MCDKNLTRKPVNFSYTQTDDKKCSNFLEKIKKSYYEKLFCYHSGPFLLLIIVYKLMMLT